MGRVKVDIYKKDTQWHQVNLSSMESVRGLLKYRSEFDLLFDKDRSVISYKDSNRDLSNISDEVICLYVDLDNLIKKCSFNKRQKEIMFLYMQGYNEDDLADVFNTTKQNINGILNSICKKICQQNEQDWLHNYVLWNKKKVDTDYKQCSKCGEWLPMTDEWFGNDSRNNDGFQSLCKKCDSLRKK